MAPTKKSAKLTYPEPNILRKRKRSANTSIPKSSPGFPIEDGVGGDFLTNVQPSSFVAVTSTKQMHYGGDGESFEKEMESSTPSYGNFMPFNSEGSSTSMPSLNKDAASNGGEDECVNSDTLRALNDIGDSPFITANHKRRVSDANVRGVNKCIRVANLRDSRKLQVDLFNGTPVGYNQKELVRHMGKLVRDRNIVPVRVHSWGEIEESVKERLWQSIASKFGGNDMDLQRCTILEHMKRLWQNWRGLMKRDHINKRESVVDALSDVPNHLTSEDWDWLVKEHYMSDEFKRISERNSENRANQKTLHRTGSKPFNEVVWSELGGKHGVQPSVSEVFKKTRMRKCGTLDAVAAAKYDEIVEVEKDQSLSRNEVIEKCFGKKDRDPVVCLGLGAKPKDVRGPLPSRGELASRLCEKEKENMKLKQRLHEIEEDRRKEHEANEKVKNLEEKVEMLMRMAFGGSSASGAAAGELLQF